MAGDWIKMRASLMRHPRVLLISRFLEHDREFMEWMTHPVQRKCNESVTEHVTFDVVTRVTVSALLMVWSSVNDALPEDSETLPGIDEFCIDAMAGVSGFGRAMVSVGWAVISENGITFPNFREYNTPSRERSAKSGAERQREYRDRKRGARYESVTKRDVTRDEEVTKSDGRTEKNRSEKKTESHRDSQSVSLPVAGGAVETTAGKAAKGRKSVFDRLEEAHLDQVPALESWLKWQASEPHPVIASPDAKTLERVVSAASIARERGEVPLALFKSMITRNANISKDDLKAARKKIKEAHSNGTR